MRYHFFLYYGWVLQNLRKDFIRTNMQTTVYEISELVGFQSQVIHVGIQDPYSISCLFCTTLILKTTTVVSNFATYSLAPASDISTEIKEEPEIKIKEDGESDLNDIKVNDTIIESDKKESIISEEEQNRISDEKVAEAIRNHNEEYYDKNDESPLESDEDFKVCLVTVIQKSIISFGNSTKNLLSFQYTKF